MELADLIARIESSDNQYAQRFERLHLGVSNPSLLAVIQSHNKCSQATADVYAATSHGLYQFMGFRLYGDASGSAKNLGYRGALWQFLTSRELQTQFFLEYVRRVGINYSVGELIGSAPKRAHFAAEYNGSANVDIYSTKILTAIRANAVA